MSKKEAEFSVLASYLPHGSLDPVLEYIFAHKVQLTLTKKRATVLGDYRHAHAGKGHRISVNGNLNPYAFLITLLHEIAHLVTFEQYGRNVSPHGKEWKSIFGKILKSFTGKGFFTNEIEIVLEKSLHNPASSSCADENLLRVLKKYDPLREGTCFVEDLAAGDRFKTADGRVFIKGPKIKKRHKCQEQPGGKWYLFSPVYEIERL